MTDASSPSGSPAAAASEPVPQKPRSRVRRIVRIGAVLGALLLVVIMLIPVLLSSGWARGQITASMSESMGVPVEIDDVSLGWFSGAELHGLRIEQPEGFEGHGRLLELEDFVGRVSLRRLLLGGEIDVQGTVEKLRLVVVENADGETNLDQLGGNDASGDAGDPDASDPSDDEPADDGASEGGVKQALADVRLDLEVRDSEVKMVREPQGVLEHLEDIRIQVTKPFGIAEIDCAFEADLRGPGDSGTPGRVELQADVDPDPGAPLKVSLRCQSLHLERYRPLIDTFVEPGAIEALAGEVDADVTVDGVPDRDVTIHGELTIAQPHFAGPLFEGMNIRGESWTLQPDVGLKFPIGAAADDAAAAGALPQMDLSGVRADFGFAKLEGLAADGAERPGLKFDIDVDALASFGGPLPELLKQTGLRTSGELRAPLRSDLGELPLGDLLGLVGVDIRIEMNQLEVGGQKISGLGASLALDAGKASFETDAGAFDGGALKLSVRSDDITSLAAANVHVEAGVSGANVGAKAIEGLQYAFPLLAGLSELPVDQRVFSSRLDFEVALDGTVAPAEGQELLAWLDGWSGGGDARLFDGKLAPAGNMSQLLQLAGNAGSTGAAGSRGLLSFKDLAGNFTLKNGAVRTALLELEAKGRKIGISGETRLSGALDYLVDARALLEEHRDGRKVLQALGEDFEIGAKLRGTLDSPSLELPDITSIVQSATQQLLQERGADAVQELLRGIGGGNGNGEGSGDPVRDAASDLLRGVLGPNRKRDDEQNEDDEKKPKAPEEQAKEKLEGLLRGVLGGGRRRGG